MKGNCTILLIATVAASLAVTVNPFSTPNTCTTPKVHSSPVDASSRRSAILTVGGMLTGGAFLNPTSTWAADEGALLSPTSTLAAAEVADDFADDCSNCRTRCLRTGLSLPFCNQVCYAVCA
jgi:hypothetical protein